MVQTGCGGSSNSDGVPLPEPSTSAGVGSITGTVSDSASGRLVPGATLTTIPETTTGTSTSSGAFTLSGIPAGTYELVIQKQNYATKTLKGVTVSDGGTVSLKILLPAGVTTVKGIVVNTRKSPLGNAQVTIVDEESGQTVSTLTTDSSGSFASPSIPSSIYTVTVAASTDGYCVAEARHLDTLFANSPLTLVASGCPTVEATTIGSAQCATCHADEAAHYADTAHAKVIKTPDAMNAEAHALFVAGAPISIDIDTADDGETLISFTPSLAADGTPQMAIAGGSPYPISKIYGGEIRKESYLTELNGSTYVLPFSWSLSAKTFVVDADEIDNWVDASGKVLMPTSAKSYEARCIGCHATGLQVEVANGVVTTTSIETSVGCERCHGAGSKHVEVAASAPQSASLYIISPRHLSLNANLELCGQCHAKGHAKEFKGATLDYPVQKDGSPYRPSEDLEAIFSIADESWGDTGKSKGYHQEYSDYLKSGHYSNRSYNPRCADCHDSHGAQSSAQNLPHLLKASVEDNSLCLGCHKKINFPNEDAIRMHTQHPYDPEGTGASRCVSCHLTKTGTLGEFGDVGGHTFSPVIPSDSLKMLQALQKEEATSISKKEIIPNPCTTCHNALRDNAEEEGSFLNVLAGDITDEDYLELLSSGYIRKFVESKPAGTYGTFDHKAVSGWMDASSPDHHGRYYLDDSSTCENACHGKDFEGGTLSDGKVVPSCFSCHYPYAHEKRIELDYGESGSWKKQHRYYYTPTACTPCHGSDYKGGISGVSCERCHSDPGEDFTQFDDSCGNEGCHPTPPQTGAHAFHYDGNYLEDGTPPAYGDTKNYSTTDSYRFGCGTCHPTSSTSHRNGKVDIELYNQSADPSTMKGKMSAEAAYDPETKTCDNVYCHSYTKYVGKDQGPVKVPFPAQFDDASSVGTSLEEMVDELNGDGTKRVSGYFVWNNFKAPDDNREAYYWSLPSLDSLDSRCSSGSTEVLCKGGVDANGLQVYPYDTGKFKYTLTYPDYALTQVRKFKQTPQWSNPTDLGCNGCHDYPPRAYLSEDGSTVSSEAAIDKHSFVIPQLNADGTVTEVGHMANMAPFSNAPIRCQVCHAATVGKKSLSEWEAGSGWRRVNGLVELDPLPIADKTRHVSGGIDVVFDTGDVATTFKFNGVDNPYTLKAYSSSDSKLTYNGKAYYYGVKGKSAPGASWSAETKTCSDVSCHLEQTSVKWTSPYRPYNVPECYQCHQQKSDPTKGENETMCWPHAQINGCED